MATGTVKWFNRGRGYGFIEPDFGPKDVFVHISMVNEDVDGGLGTGERVEFELTQLGDGRLSAQVVKRIANIHV